MTAAQITSQVNAAHPRPRRAALAGVAAAVRATESVQARNARLVREAALRATADAQVDADREAA